MFELLKDFLLKTLGIALPFVVRWFYKPAKFASGIKVRIMVKETVSHTIAENFRVFVSG